MSLTKELDSIDLEFQYYCSLFEELFCLLPNRCQQYLATRWNRKLTEPIYNAGGLREKRNKYLLMLTLCLNLGVLKYPFDKLPPSGILPDISSIRNPNKSSLVGKSTCPTESQQKTCDFHENECPIDEDNISKILDNQFEFLIRLADQNVEKLSDISDRRRGRQWIKFLSSIDTPCFHMKGVRNDYAMLLAGYVLNDELPGPFLQSPIEKLIPLDELVKIIDMKNHMVIDPSHPKAMRFLKDVPHPKEGAFAFLAVTGNICGDS
ncbi:uncharacterized protein LOC129908944 [Episyrphus balteatus]|uniref:uncharacterized protein LOC129908944 n=1 Tax=Episyrphus balteatus TaxID=286459 RepID=UPI002486BAD2|nr:uncharacterized protein LOC129908944 [Episyrphus balteatus]